MYESYAGEKSLNVVEGGHNSSRQRHVLEKIAKFFATYLFRNNDDKNSDFESVNGYVTKNEDYLKGISEDDI